MAGIQKGGPVWTAGSVREGEVSLVLDAFLEARKTVKDLRLVLAPRHLDGLNDIETRARTEKLTASRRSSGGDTPRRRHWFSTMAGRSGLWLTRARSRSFSRTHSDASSP